MPARRKGDRRRQRAEDASVERRTGADRRRSIRVLVDLEVDYQCEDTYLFAYITDVSAMGIFVRTNNPEAIGTRLNLRFALPNDPHPLELEGQVTWINPFRPGDLNNLHPGMGVKFINLDDATRQRLLALIRTIALLEDNSEHHQVALPDDN